MVFAPTVLLAQTLDSIPILERDDYESRLGSHFIDQIFENPAIKQYEQTYSYSSVGVGWDYRHDDEVVSTQEGRGSDRWIFNADTYMKYKNSTLWGNAYYNNGHIRDMLWNETSDINLVYPYVMADAVGGDMNMERYSFSGGYSMHSGIISWGGFISYTAGLYYRNVDPRPRNITSSLYASLGIGMELLEKYVGAVSVTANKYKQTNDIEFKSEMGVSTIYHMTGLGNDYYRFMGVGYSPYYNGRSYGASLDAYPLSGYGLSATVRFNRFTFDNILSDMNNLPMAHVGENKLSAQVGFRLQSGLSLKYDILYVHRDGTENIFGDPASSIYPQIGSLPMYTNNIFITGLAGIYEKGFDKATFAVSPLVYYSHNNETYADPFCQQLLNDITCGLSAQYGTTFSSHDRVSCVLSYEFRTATDSELTLPEGDSRTEAMDVVERDFGFSRANRSRYALSLKVTHALNSRYALQLGVDYSCKVYNTSELNKSQAVTASLCFLF